MYILSLCYFQLIVDIREYNWCMRSHAFLKYILLTMQGYLLSGKIKQNRKMQNGNKMMNNMCMLYIYMYNTIQYNAQKF